MAKNEKKTKHFLTIAQKNEVVRLVKTGKHTTAQLAEKFCVAPSTITRTARTHQVLEPVASKEPLPANVADLFTELYAAVQLADEVASKLGLKVIVQKA